MSFLFFIFLKTAFAMSAKKFKAPEPILKKTKYEVLEIMDYHQFDVDEDKKFNLSGMVLNKSALEEKFDDKSGNDPAGRFFATSDRGDTTDIYMIDWNKSKFRKAFPHKISGRYSLRAIDRCGQTFYVVNAANDSVSYFEEGEEPKKIELDLTKYKIHRGFLSGSGSFEGLAVDCENGLMYLVNSKEPRFFLTYDLTSKKIIAKWDISQKDSSDISDLKFEKGYLYGLERSDMDIAKIDVKTHEVIAKFSYQNFEKKFGYLFGPAKHAFGDALLLTDTEIWVGFNNKGLAATRQASHDFKIQGRKPLVVRIHRPENF